MTREGSLARLGVDLGSIDATRIADPRTPDCPGARVRVTRYDFDALVSGGERFETLRKDIPYDGYGDARVHCGNAVAQIPQTTSRAVLYYGLCHSCSSLEVRNREELRERAKVRGDRS